jgi:succinate dehydrogenase / fumarate reductase iron-sulfur subunit
MGDDKYVLRIWRGNPGKQYWEEFELIRRIGANIITALSDIQKNPINREGGKVAPVVWESGCLEEVCGSCSMLINGKPRQACTALIESLIAETKSTIITLAPFSKFPLLRDLVVDRSSMFEHLKKVSAWVEADNSKDRGSGPKISPQKQEIMYQLSACMTCGCCLEACPQVNERSSFMGPAVIGQVRLFNLHPVAGMQKAQRIRLMMQEGGVSGCGNAHNCVAVCPKKIPLTDAIAVVGGDATKRAIKDLFSLPDRDNE